MSEEISDAGHGPAGGYSGMRDVLNRYFAKHPTLKEEQESRSRCLGRTIYRRKKKKRAAARRYKGQHGH